MTDITPALRDNTPLAVAAILITVFALALGDAVIKGVSAEFTLWQIFTIRSVVVLPMLAVIVKLRHDNLSFWPQQPNWTILRSLLLTFMWVAYYSALPHVDLSIAAAAYYTLPLFISLFAAFFLGDAIGRTGWAAIAIGFIGVWLILQPEAEQFSWFALLPVISAILYALAMILTRSRCRLENVLVLSVWLNLSMLVVGVVVSGILVVLELDEAILKRQAFLLGTWTDMGSKEWTAIGILSVAITIGSVGAAFAYQTGRSATVATFDFAYVAFAAIWGFLLFWEVPGTKSVIGIVLIVIAGILAVRRQRSIVPPNRVAGVFADGSQSNPHASPHGTLLSGSKESP